MPLLKYVTTTTHRDTWLTMRDTLEDAQRDMRADTSGLIAHIEAWRYYQAANGTHHAPGSYACNVVMTRGTADDCDMTVSSHRSNRLATGS